MNAVTPNIMIVEGRFYEDIADQLVDGAIRALEAADADHDRFPVPGVFEIPAMIRYALRSRDFQSRGRRFDGFIVLGCVIRGETSHYDLVCQESTRKLQDLAVEYTLAMGYGILTVENMEQARVRAAVDGRNKGGAAAAACLRMIELKRQFHLFPR